MNDVGDQDDRNRQIGDCTVGLGDQGQQAELGDAEIRQAAAQGDQDRLQDGFALIGLCLFFRCLDRVSDAPDHGGDHVDGSCHGAQNDQDGNNGSQDRGADAMLHHEQGRHRGGCHVGICEDGQKSQYDDQHESGVNDPAEQHTLTGILRLFKDPAVLYEKSDIAELESAVQKGGVKGLSERNRGGLHSCHGLGDPRRICEDIGDIDGDQSDDDHDGQNGRDPAQHT